MIGLARKFIVLISLSSFLNFLSKQTSSVPSWNMCCYACPWFLKISLEYQFPIAIQELFIINILSKKLFIFNVVDTKNTYYTLASWADLPNELGRWAGWTSQADGAATRVGWADWVAWLDWLSSVEYLDSFKLVGWVSSEPMGWAN